MSQHLMRSSSCSRNIFSFVSILCMRQHKFWYTLRSETLMSAPCGVINVPKSAVESFERNQKVQQCRPSR
uniref:Uncharacterized protein n=1 Tax=Arion vulgaris TaxID=1028688 RepID=A0A0B7AZK8_9EUPU